MTIGAGVWYWWYFNSRHAREYARPIVEYTVPRAVGLSQVSFVDVSLLSTTLTIGLPVVPWVNPTVSLTHNYYTGLKRGGDYYVQLGLNHPFEATREVIITPAISAGYYYSTTSRLTRYSALWDVSASYFDTTPSLSFSGQTRVITLGCVKQTRTPLEGIPFSPAVLITSFIGLTLIGLLFEGESTYSEFITVLPENPRRRLTNDSRNFCLPNNLHSSFFTHGLRWTCHQAAERSGKHDHSGDRGMLPQYVHLLRHLQGTEVPPQGHGHD